MAKTCEYNNNGKICGFPKVWKYIEIDGVRTAVCKTHSHRLKPTPIKKMTDKKKDELKENRNYYRQSIGSNIIKNSGKCLCDNCKSVIPAPSGSNVSHILSKGSYSSMYHHPMNHFIFCWKCEQEFSNEGKRDTMAIYEAYLKRKEYLINFHYGKK